VCVCVVGGGVGGGGVRGPATPQQEGLPRPPKKWIYSWRISDMPRKRWGSEGL
jgi:hypothetical protein